MNVHREFQDSAKKFIKYCDGKFKRRDVSTEVIMDIGCGRSLYCGNAILGEYPEAREVIAIDRDPEIIRYLRLSKTKIRCYTADIEKRDTLESFIGNMTKVFSIRAFHELKDIQTAFQNVYRLLQPGGAAAFLFYSRSSPHEWFLEMIKIPKWKNVYKGCFNTDSFLRGISTQQYIDMVQKIGFEVVECSEKENEWPFETDVECIDNLHSAFQRVLKVPPELLQEFQQDALQIYEKISERDAENRLVDRLNNRTLLLVKPTTAHRS